MDFNTALEILEVTEPYTKKLLKKQYLKKALLYHPDKNSDPDSNAKFIKIRDAYTYLSDNIDISNNEPNNSDNYFDIIEQLFNLMKNNSQTNTSDIINVLLENCNLISLSTFEKIDKHNALKIFGYIERYASILCIDDDMVDDILHSALARRGYIRNRRPLAYSKVHTAITRTCIYR